MRVSTQTPLKVRPCVQMYTHITMAARPHGTVNPIQHRHIILSYIKSGICNLPCVLTWDTAQLMVL